MIDPGVQLQLMVSECRHCLSTRYQCWVCSQHLLGMPLTTIAIHNCDYLVFRRFPFLFLPLFLFLVSDHGLDVKTFGSKGWCPGEVTTYFAGTGVLHSGIQKKSHRHRTFAIWSQQLLFELSWVLLMMESAILHRHLS